MNRTIKLVHIKNIIFLLICIFIYFYLIRVNNIFNIPLSSDLIIILIFLLTGLFNIFYNASFFSPVKLFINVFYSFGTIIRYLLIRIYPQNFMEFSYYKYPILNEFFIKTNGYILLSLLSSLSIFIFFSKPSLRRKEFLETENTFFNKKENNYIYVLVSILVIVYEVFNRRSATDGQYGMFDNITNYIITIIKLFGVNYFIKYIRLKKIKYLYLFLLLFIPDTVISLVNAWKGGLITNILIIIICISVYSKKDKIIRRFGVIFIAFCIVFPIISMYRDNLVSGIKQEINLQTVIQYLNEKNPIISLSNRFQYYDEMYVCFNLDKSTIETYNAESGLIHTKILSGLIPRFLWNSKPIISNGRTNAIIITKLPEQIYNNVAISYLGEIFISYGLLGIIVINLLLSLFILRLTKINYNSSLNIAIYVIFTVQIISFLEGSVASQVINLSFIYILFNLINKLALLSNDKTKKSNVNNFFNLN